MTKCKRYKYKQLLLSLIGCLLVFISPFGLAFEFEGDFPSREYPFEIKSSGIEVRADESTKVEWLDDHRVIFSALNPGEPRLQSKKYRKDHETINAPGRVVIWDTRNGGIEDLGEGKLNCSHRGHISMFWMRPDKLSGKPEAFIRSGMYGSLKEHPGWREGERRRYIDMHTCRIYDKLRTEPAPDHWHIHLKEEDGFLDLGPRKPKKGEKRPQIKIVRPEGTRQTLPLTMADVDTVRWSDWAGVYTLGELLWGGSSLPVEPDYIKILHKDGTLQRYRVPDSYSRKSSTYLSALTRRGLVVTNYEMFAGALIPNKGRSGMYLIRDDKVVRLISWRVGNQEAYQYSFYHRGIAVSKDGCKIAFKHGAGELRKVAHTIKMINVCEEI